MGRRIAVSFVALILVAGLAHAQIGISSFSGTYVQNFNGLANTGTTATRTNNTTLPGWFLYDSNSAAITSYRVSNGSDATGSFDSFGATSSTDRSLGGIGESVPYFGNPANNSIAGYIAVAFNNNTGATIRAANISFDGEQWRAANGSADTMVFEYGFGATFTGVTTWTAPGGNYNWTSPNNSNLGAIDGNTTGLVAGRGGALNLNLTPLTNGQTIWFRWDEQNSPGTDHGLGIDNFNFTPVPEPISLFAIGAVAVGLIGVGRRLLRKRPAA